MEQRVRSASESEAYPEHSPLQRAANREPLAADVVLRKTSASSSPLSETILPSPFLSGTPHTAYLSSWHQEPERHAPARACRSCSRTAAGAPPAEGRLPIGGSPVALASPFAHALDVFLGVIAVAVAVAKGGREETPPLPALSQSMEMPSSQAASEILYVVSLFSPMSPR